MPQMRPVTLAVAAIVAFVALGVLYVMTGRAVHLSGRPPSLAQLQPMTPARLPDLIILDAKGRQHTLAEYKGRYVLLNLWAMWCAPCVRELPALAKLQAAMPHGGLEIAAVDIGRSDPDTALEFLKAHQASDLQAYFDPHLSLMKVFGAFGLPLSVLVDPEGREVAHAMGPAGWDDPAAIDYFKTLTANASS